MKGERFPHLILHVGLEMAPKDLDARKHFVADFAGEGSHLAHFLRRVAHRRRYLHVRVIHLAFQGEATIVCGGNLSVNQ